MVLQEQPARSREGPLFSQYSLGSLRLTNRLVMAPMTRSHSLAGDVPNPLEPSYNAQRAGAGLIVTEPTNATPDGGYFRTPGIHSAEQVVAWRKVTAAVHAAGGRIFLQIWHTGRTSHPEL